MKLLTKKYQVWTYNGDGGYSMQEYDTAEEAILATKYSSDWYITQRVELIIKEKTNEEVVK